MANTAMDTAMDAWGGLFRGAKDRAHRFMSQKTPIDEGTGQPDVAPRDAAWVELFSVDKQVRYGRGHLFLWLVQSADEDYMKAELRSFTVDQASPEANARLAVRPEQEMEMYPVIVVANTPVEGDVSIIGLIWPDTQLPSVLSEVGGE